MNIVQWKLLGSVNADFFVTGIAPDFTRVCYALGPCFLSPFVHLVLTKAARLPLA